MEYTVVIRTEKSAKQSVICAALEKAGAEVVSFNEKPKGLLGGF